MPLFMVTDLWLSSYKLAIVLCKYVHFFARNRMTKNSVKNSPLKGGVTNFNFVIGLQGHHVRSWLVILQNQTITWIVKRMASSLNSHPKNANPTVNIKWFISLLKRGKMYSHWQLLKRKWTFQSFWIGITGLRGMLSIWMLCFPIVMWGYNLAPWNLRAVFGLTFEGMSL